MRRAVLSLTRYGGMTRAEIWEMSSKERAAWIEVLQEMLDEENTPPPTAGGSDNG